ncbi:MAG: hypothetical protein NTZ74_09435 [Chloroflexi bacterium]|nr:hypothetical protein [Chloroflexota bacterium]
MSLYELRSEVNRLEREYSQVQAINRELKSELATVANGVSQAHNTLENFNRDIQNTLQNSDNMMQSSHQRVIDAIELQGEIEKLYVRFKNIELANKKIRAANNKKYYDFSNYRIVRKIVQGIIDNLDVNMVSDQTIMKSVEVQHLQTPDYWLTCVLISVMAWKNDDKELADRAIARAINLDKMHTAIFFMLFNLRLERNEAALKWFATYQECEQKGSNQRTFLMLFSLISKTIVESVDENIRNQITDFINRIILLNGQAEGYSEEDIIAKIRYNYTHMKPPGQVEYSLLRKYCDVFNDLSANILRAKNNINILGFILKTVNVPVEQRNEFVKGYIDEIIATPNQTEESVYEEIFYNELVIKLEGDVDTAKVQLEAEKLRAKNDINLISEVVGWIYERDNQEIQGQIRLNMFTLTKDLQEKAIQANTEDYRIRKTTFLPITINDYSTTADFRQESDEAKKIEIYYTNIKNNARSTIKDWKAFLSFGMAALALVGAFFLGYWLFSLTAIGIGLGVFVLLSNKSHRNQLELTCKENIRIATDILQKLFFEYKQYQAQFDEYDAFHDQIINELNKI